MIASPPTQSAPDAEAVIAVKRAPVQDRTGIVTSIPWEMHLRAYAAYCKKWSPQPALIQGGCRGGFGTGELDDFIPGWRDELPELDGLSKQVAALLTALEAANRRVGVLEGALDAIKNGRINTDFVMSDPPDWHSAFGQLQAIARRALPDDTNTTGEER